MGSRCRDLENAFASSYTIALSVASAQALLSAAASGMMALTGIVFAMAFVMVQFSAIAYSPRLVLWFARDRMLFHALGMFMATFVYALFTLAWVDRGGSGNVPVFSMLLVGIMIIISMLMFARLMQRLGDLQIGNVLHLVGDQGRAVIAEMFRRLEEASAAPRTPQGAAAVPPFRHVTQAVHYFGKPRIVAKLDVEFSCRPGAKSRRDDRGGVRCGRHAGRGHSASPEFMTQVRCYRRAHSDAPSDLSVNGPSSRTQSIRSGFSWTSQ